MHCDCAKSSCIQQGRLKVSLVSQLFGVKTGFPSSLRNSGFLSLANIYQWLSSYRNTVRLSGIELEICLCACADSAAGEGEYWGSVGSRVKACGVGGAGGGRAQGPAFQRAPGECRSLLGFTS